MVIAQIATGWRMDVDRGPDWMFVRLHPAEEIGPSDLSLAEKVWSILQQAFIYRVVLELDEVEMLHSSVIAQLVMLAKRIHSHNGMLRLCGLSEANQEVIHICRLGECLPNYGSRGDAVMGHRPARPR